jgi:hypothetical protein
MIEHLYDQDMSSIRTTTETRMAEIAGQLNVLNAELITLIAGAISDRSWSGHGIHTPTHWLTIQLGAATGRANQLVETATHAASFPTIIAEFTAGRLSLDQTHVIVTKAPAWADPQLVNTATSATVPQLHRMIRNDYFEGPDTPNTNTTPGTTNTNTCTGATDTTDEVVSVADTSHTSTTTDADADTSHTTADTPTDTTSPTDAPPTSPVAPVVADRVSFGWNGSRFTGTFDLAADTGAILEAALDEARDALFRDGITDVTWADALTETALRSLDHTPRHPAHPVQDDDSRSGRRSTWHGTVQQRCAVTHGDPGLPDL